MIEFVDLTPELLKGIEPQPAQRMPPDMYAQALAAPTGGAKAALVDGVPIAAAGVLELWPGRGHAWALLSVHAGPHLGAITRAIRRQLEALPLRRIEMAVDAQFPEAVRWAYMLGFECETPEPMRNYLPNGGACYLFARVH